MKARLLIVEDQFIEANNLKIILKKAGFSVCNIARTVDEAVQIIDQEKPDLVLLDIYLDGPRTGIDLAYLLQERNISFVYLSANSNKQTLDAAKATNPHGFLVKPFREKDVLVMLDIALYRNEQNPITNRISARKEMTPKSNDGFDLIKGQSKSIKVVLENVLVVSKSDVSVLILGESGTGKELIAKAIHLNSRRKNNPLVVVNCATLPANLIESELFGHEKGAFTGAIEQHIGKFEQANGGTVFLDEIGELPLELQVKFLRVLQEKEIEPIGGKRKPVNVRVLAATNKNLVDEMASGRFRMDLYYRLNVFPIVLPALKNRKDDIPILAEYYLQQFSIQEEKLISGFSPDAMNELIQYSWPGNIRELKNVIERAVLLTAGSTVEAIFLLNAKQNSNQIKEGGYLKTMSENERDHIIAVLENCNWKIYGEGGAAEVLDMNGNTLHSRMKKLGIEKDIYKNK